MRVVSNWISAGARLVPLGQTDSQRILASLEADVAATAKRALEASLDDLGSATFRADLASLRHETQYTTAVPVMMRYTLSSSLRTQGPIATGLRCCTRRRPFCFIDRSRGMGPCAVRNCA